MRAHDEPRGGRKKKRKAQSQDQRHPGPERGEHGRERVRGQGKKQTQGTERLQEKPRDTKGRGGNHQATPNSQAGNTKGARARGLPRSARQTGQTTHSAKAQGTLGRKPRRQETKGARDNGNKKEKKDQDGGNRSPEGAKQRRQSKRPKEIMRRTGTRPGGRPARPSQEEQAHAHTHGTRAWRPPTRKWRCRRPHETAPVHRPSPPWNDGRSRKPDASVTGSTHANHRSAHSPRPTPEGPARDNPIAGP